MLKGQGSVGQTRGRWVSSIYGENGRGENGRGYAVYYRYVFERFKRWCVDSSTIPQGYLLHQCYT